MVHGASPSVPGWLRTGPRLVLTYVRSCGNGDGMEVDEEPETEPGPSPLKGMGTKKLVKRRKETLEIEPQPEPEPEEDEGDEPVERPKSRLVRRADSRKELAL